MVYNKVKFLLDLQEKTFVEHSRHSCGVVVIVESHIVELKEAGDVGDVGDLDIADIGGPG